MYRLLTLLSSYRNAILFVVLELVAFFLIINNNNRQRHLMGDALFDMTSSMSQSKGSVRQYFDLREQNEDLRQRSTDLEKKLDEAEKKIQAYEALLALDTLPKMSIDSLLSHESYIYIPARVIKNTIHKNYNYFTVNKGRLDGVVEGMGVVSPQGVAGKVIDMGDHYSLGLSALNVSFKLTLQAIDASGESFEGNIGIYEWKGGDPRYADLTYIPETVSLQEGFAVLTSGFSTVFPAGYQVGTIYSLGKQSEDGFYSARIKLATEFHALGNVVLIGAEHKPEVDSLEINLPEE